MVADAGPETLLPCDEVVLDAIIEEYFIIRTCIDYVEVCLLCIIVAQSALKDTRGAQLFETLVDEQRHFVVVLVRFVAQTKDL